MAKRQRTEQTEREGRELARKHAETAIAVLARIAQNRKAGAKERLAAAVAILDRAFGKPPQEAPAETARAIPLEVVRLIHSATPAGKDAGCQ